VDSPATVHSPSQDDARVDIQGHLEQASNYNEWIARQAREYLGNRVIDAGCGAGNITELMTDRELVIGVEVWDEFFELLQARFATTPNVELLHFDLTDPALSDALAEHRPDSAMSCNVLEHIEDDRTAIANITAPLPGGAPVFLLVPAFPVLFGEHDRLDHHLRRYKRRSLAETIAPLPLEIESMRYMNMPGFFAWFLLGRALRQPLSEGQISLYDRIVPAIAALERRLPPPFGQSLVARLRKRR
jgi:SAM-dependent methyltransferase